MAKNKLLIIAIAVFLSGLMLITGCGQKKECTQSSDCPLEKCFNTRCIDNKCVNTKINECCGNKVCESNESKCSCGADCGACGAPAGKNASTGLLRYVCENDKCIMGLSNVVDKPLMQLKTFTKFKYSEVFTFASPFNLKDKALKYNAELTDKKEEVQSIKITKVQVIITLDNKKLIIGDTNIDKYLYNIGDKIEGEVNLAIDYDKAEFKAKPVIKVFYEMTYKKITGELEVERANYDYTLSSDISFVNPPDGYECTPEMCNDNNSCTVDACVDGTKLCEYQRKPKCCGNFECEAGENKCTCANDCGSCDLAVGEYMAYSCTSTKECVLKAISNPKSNTLSEDLTLDSFLVLILKNSYDEPFNLKSSEFVAEITLQNIKSTDTKQFNAPLRIERIQLLDGENLVAEVIPIGSNTFNSIGDKQTFKISPKANYQERELKKTLTQKFYYSYSITTNSDITEVRNSVVNTFKSQILMINPDVG